MVRDVKDQYRRIFLRHNDQLAAIGHEARGKRNENALLEIIKCRVCNKAVQVGRIAGYLNRQMGLGDGCGNLGVLRGQNLEVGWFENIDILSDEIRVRLDIRRWENHQGRTSGWDRTSF